MGRGERHWKTALQSNTPKDADKQSLSRLDCSQRRNLRGRFSGNCFQSDFEKVQEVLKNRAKPRHSKKAAQLPIYRTTYLRRVWRGHYRPIRAWARRHIQILSLHQAAWLVFAKLSARGPAHRPTENRNLKSRSVRRLERKMLAQVEVWEKENIQSSQSFAQNLEKEIKETEAKLDRLVNAFLDGSIEKETYLAKRTSLSLPKQTSSEGSLILGERETIGSNLCANGF